MTLVVCLPDAAREWRWFRTEGDAVVATGEGVPDPGEERVVAVAPGEAVTLHWAELPVRSPAQAAAAARLLVAEASATPLGELHVAVGAEDGAERSIAVVGAAAMADWLSALAAAGLDPAAIVPAPLLLPRPDEGYVTAEVAGEPLVRGISSGFVDEPGVTELIVAGEPVAALSPDELGAALAAAAAIPPLDLRQGPFARRRRRAIDWSLVRRLATLAAAVLLVTLAIQVVRLLKLETDAGRLEARADELARGGLPAGATVTDPDRQLDERLRRVRGPGQGFSASVAAIAAAVRQVPGAELTSLSFGQDGQMRLGVATQSEAAPTDLRNAIQAAGYHVEAGTFASAKGRVTGMFTVSLP